jgi:molybdate transport system ATP-binding protein
VLFRSRALAASPRALLLDEPFSALDPLLRTRMRAEVRRICAELDTPTLLVTHDPEDAAEFGGTVVLYDAGRACCASAFPDGPDAAPAADGVRAYVLGRRFAAYAETPARHDCALSSGAAV